MSKNKIKLSEKSFIDTVERNIPDFIKNSKPYKGGTGGGHKLSDLIDKLVDLVFKKIK